jgi:hypothetical protein
LERFELKGDQSHFKGGARLDASSLALGQCGIVVVVAGGLTQGDVPDGAGFSDPGFSAGTECDGPIESDSREDSLSGGAQATSDFGGVAFEEKGKGYFLGGQLGAGGLCSEEDRNQGCNELNGVFMLSHTS